MKLNTLSPSRLLGILVTAALLSVASAQEMNYQGRATDVNGNPLTDGTYSIHFSLYDHPTAGMKVWGPFRADRSSGETLTDGHTYKAELVGGRFNVAIGPKDVNGLELTTGLAGGDRYLSIQVGNNPATTPRQKLLRSPSAMHAVSADFATSVDLATNSTHAYGLKHESSGKEMLVLADDSTLLMKGGTFVGADSGGLGDVGPGLRIFYDSTTTDAQIFAYKYPTATDPSFGDLNLKIQGEGGDTKIGGDTEIGGELNLKKKLTFFGAEGDRKLEFKGSSSTTGEVGRISMRQPNQGGFDIHYNAADDRLRFERFSGLAATPGASLGSPLAIRLSNGRVGIGTDTPAVPLHVVGGVTNSDGFDSDKYSLKLSDESLTMGNDTYSDARIKNILGISKSASDLETLSKIEITNYTYKDAAKGTRPIKKVIAQQVDSVFPQAVNKVQHTIPDMLETAAIDKEGWISLKTDLTVGERVTLKTVEGQNQYEVLDIHDGAFRTSFKPNGDITEIFVYGREVSDFHVVDYDEIAMLNVSATQELHRRLEVKDQAISDLQERLGRLETEAKANAQKFAAIEQFLSKQQVETVPVLATETAFD